MDNQDTKLPDNSKRSLPTDVPEVADKQNNVNFSSSAVVNNIQPKLGKKRHVLRNILLFIGGLVIVIVIIVTLIIISIAKDVTKPNNPADVQAAYTQTANKTATQLVSTTSNPVLFTKQSLPPDKSSGRTNEVDNLYCYTVNSNANAVDEINQGFPQNDPWTYMGQANGAVTAISSLPNTLQQTGTINLRYETQGDKLSTNNPNYNAAAVAYITISLPSSSNQCSTPAHQDKVNTTNKLIVALQLDLFDYPYGKAVTVWQSPANGVQHQSLTNELNQLGLTNTDKQTYINVTNEEDEYYPDPEYSFGTFAQISETIDVCIAGNESPAIAVSTIYNDFINTGWLNTNGGNYWSLSDAVTAIESNHIGEVGFDFSKNTSYGQIIVAFDPDGTFTDGPPDCSLGSYAHAFAISMSYSPNFNVE